MAVFLKLFTFSSFKNQNTKLISQNKDVLRRGPAGLKDCDNKSQISKHFIISFNDAR